MTTRPPAGGAPDAENRFQDSTENVKTNKNTLRAPTAARWTPRELVSPILLKDTASNRRPARLLRGLNKGKKKKKKGEKV